MEIKFKISRYDPSRKEKTGYGSYYLNAENRTTILDGLNFIRWQKDGTLAFRNSCNCAVCGSCAIMVNGGPCLACKTRILDVVSKDGEVLIEPLRNFPVIKDLVVDMRGFFARIEKIKPWFLNGPEEERTKSLEETLGDIDFMRTDECIMCGICYSACNVYEANKDYHGPASLIKGYQFVVDKRDVRKNERLKILAGDHGLWQCARCYTCSEVCPKDIPLTSAIVSLRAIACRNRIGDRAGAEHALAFWGSVKRWGRLIEFLLPLTSSGLNMMSFLPWALKMILKGKVRFALPRPIPGIGEIRYLFALNERRPR